VTKKVVSVFITFSCRQQEEEYRREFLGNVSHELKTPLFTVQGYISTLLDGDG
jgi:signal transduction histidine kinase